MATADTDNVIPLQPGTAPEQPARAPGNARSKDRRAAARQAKKRSKIKADRDAGPVKNAPPSSYVDAPPIAPSVAQTARNGVTVRDAYGVDNIEGPRAPQRHGAAVDVAAYGAAIALAGAAAWFSIRGMIVLFPGSPMSVVGMAVAMEGAKLITAGWLTRRWRATAWLWRLVLVVLVAGLAVINAAGVYAQLVSAHVGERGAAQSDLETKEAAITARLESQIHIVADLDRRLGQIDTTIEEAARRGRTKTAIDAIEAQRRARAALVDERKREAATLWWTCRRNAPQWLPQGRKIETEAAPIRYVAELLGVDTDSERAIRWLIALMVLCCDPLAIGLTAAASARR